MKFAIYGPFPIPRGEKGLITKGNVTQFWKEFAEEWGDESLAKAHGAYVFAIKAPRTDKSKPWYVGKAGKTFKQEVLNAENINKYNGKLDTVKRVRRGCSFCRNSTRARAFRGKQTASTRQHWN